ncbi:hypothetical protein ACTFIV_000298 [Dictyostelium citrinum]
MVINTLNKRVYTLVLLTNWNLFVLLPISSCSSTIISSQKIQDLARLAQSAERGANNATVADESLSYSSLQKKWHKLATLEYIKKAKDLKNLSTKDHNNFKDPMILLTSTIKLRKITANYYCIPESSLPNIISFDQFI